MNRRHRNERATAQCTDQHAQHNRARRHSNGTRCAPRSAPLLASLDSPRRTGLYAVPYFAVCASVLRPSGAVRLASSSRHAAPPRSVVFRVRCGGRLRRVHRASHDARSFRGHSLCLAACWPLVSRLWCACVRRRFIPPQGGIPKMQMQMRCIRRCVLRVRGFFVQHHPHASAWWLARWGSAAVDCMPPSTGGHASRGAGISRPPASAPQPRAPISFFAQWLAASRSRVRFVFVSSLLCAPLFGLIFPRLRFHLGASSAVALRCV